MLLILFVLISLVGAAFAVPAQSVPYFAGRSANIIVQPENAVYDNSAILLHGKQLENQLKTIEDTRVADLFAHVMGTQPFNVLASREGFPKGDLFQKPKAAFLVTLESVAPGLFAKYSTWKDYQSVDLTTSTYPANTFTMTSNIATGTKPSVHGIVGEAWIMPNGEKIGAHISTEGSSLAANMADILTQEWDGDSLTLSASAFAPVASAFAASAHTSGHNYGLSLENRAFSTIYSRYELNPFALAEEDLEAIFKATSFSSFLGASMVYSNNDQLAVTVGSITTTFDLTTLVDYSLFAELGFVYNFLNTLETDSRISALVVDSVPDFYSFAFASLKGIKATHGEQSDMFIASLLLVDNAIQQAVAKIDTLYNGRTVSAVACLDTQTVVSDKIKAAVYESARTSLQSQEDFDLHFPSLYVRNGKAAQACTRVKNALGKLAEVHCFASTFDWVVEDNNYGATNTTQPLNVAAFWIFVFFPITILLVVLTGIYALCAAGVEASKDSLLFRSAGRHH
jgi:hypothetical protein